MGSNKYMKLKSLLQAHFPDYIVPLKVLRLSIIKHIGGDSRTIDSYLKLALDTGLMEDMGNEHFKINGEIMAENDQQIL